MAQLQISTPLPTFPGFRAMRIPVAEWLSPPKHREGERVLWSDGTAHNLPENESDTITVLRRK